MPAHGYPRYCQLWKKWLAWLENRWAKDGTGEVERRAKETVYFMYTEASLDPDEKKRKKLTNWARRSESEHHIRAMISLAKTEAGIPVTPDQLDTHAWMLNCLNGTLELKTGQLRPWRGEDLITKIVLSEYLPEAGCPTWEKFLARITRGNENLITFLQRVAGYAATGDTSEQVFFLLWGLKFVEGIGRSSLYHRWTWGYGILGENLSLVTVVVLAAFAIWFLPGCSRKATSNGWRYYEREPVP